MRTETCLHKGIWGHLPVQCNTMEGMKTKGHATIDDLYNVPEDGQKYELVDGEIVVSPAGFYHSQIAVRIGYLLLRFLEDSPLGIVCGADVGIILPNGNLRSPDVSFIKNEKLPGGKAPETFGEIIPDLVVEVLSPSDNMRQVADKIGEFLECDVPLVWLVDPKARTVTVYRSLTDTRQLAGDDTIDAAPVLPGFTTKVSDFF